MFFCLLISVLWNQNTSLGGVQLVCGKHSLVRQCTSVSITCSCFNAHHGEQQHLGATKTYLYFFSIKTLGPSVLAGVAVMVLLIPFNAAIAMKTRAFQVRSQQRGWRYLNWQLCYEKPRHRWLSWLLMSCCLHRLIYEQDGTGIFNSCILSDSFSIANWMLFKGKVWHWVSGSS